MFPAPGAVTQPYWLPLPPLPGPPAPLHTLVDGAAIETGHGQFFLRRTVLPLDHGHGGCAVGDFLGLDTQIMAALGRAPELADVSLDRVLFLDTETTGLAGGTGTYVFLVGLGYFECDSGVPQFVLDQCFMRSYGEERALLGWLAAHLEQFEALCTFNGKPFDVPLLSTRFRLARHRVDLDEVPHLDLLPPARRIWRAALPSCSLMSLERNVLGVGRTEDIDSFLIPAIYHQFLKDGDGRYLQRVFNHNQVDVLSMVSLAVRACRLFDEGQRAKDHTVAGPSGGRAPAGVSPVEHFGLARVYEQMENLAAAERAYRASIAGALPRELRWRAFLSLAALLKRTARMDEAAEIWQHLADEAPSQGVVALLELAKYWEHVRRDPARAHALTLRARDTWLSRMAPAERRLPGLGGGLPGMVSGYTDVTLSRPPDDFERRLARLARKGAVPAGQAATVSNAVVGTPDIPAMSF